MSTLDRPRCQRPPYRERIKAHASTLGSRVLSQKSIWTITSDAQMYLARLPNILGKVCRKRLNDTDWQARAAGGIPGRLTRHALLLMWGWITYHICRHQTHTPTPKHREQAQVACPVLPSRRGGEKERRREHMRAARAKNIYSSDRSRGSPKTKVELNLEKVL